MLKPGILALFLLALAPAALASSCLEQVDATARQYRLALAAPPGPPATPAPGEGTSTPPPAAAPRPQPEALAGEPALELAPARRAPFEALLAGARADDEAGRAEACFAKLREARGLAREAPRANPDKERAAK
jgi:hypothetical protein